MRIIIIEISNVNTRKQTEDRVINNSVVFIFWKPTFFHIFMGVRVSPFFVMHYG